MADTLFLAEAETPCSLECTCPNCGQSLMKGLIEVNSGSTVETVCCPNNCDLRPFTFLARAHG